MFLLFGLLVLHSSRRAVELERPTRHKEKNQSDQKKIKSSLNASINKTKLLMKPCNPFSCHHEQLATEEFSFIALACFCVAGIAGPFLCV
jgi:hypothetical protein